MSKTAFQKIAAGLREAIRRAPNDGCITDPTAYHRLRIIEALAFEGPLDAIQNLGGVIADLEHSPEPDKVAIRTLRRVQGQLYAVRDLCAEGDRT